MAYKIERAERLTDTLQFVSRSGEVAMEIDINIDIPRIASQYRSCFVKIAEAQKKAEEAGGVGEALEALGTIVLEGYGLIFGDDATERMVAFFEEDYTEMLEQTLPFIAHVVVPRIEEFVDKRKRSIKQQYAPRKRWGHA